MIRALILILAASLPLIDLAFAQPQPKAGRKVALLIGVNGYTNRNLEPLRFAEPDVTALAAELTKAGFEVRTLRGADGIDPNKKVTGKDAYFAALTETLRGVGRADTVPLAFSGHGVQLQLDAREQPFFCPADAVPTDATTLVSLNAVLKQLDERGGGHNLVLVDACRNIVDPNRGARGGINGSRIDNLPEGTAIFFSCSGRQKARETDKMFPSDGGKKGHGVFFHFVLEGLRGAAGATDGRGRVTWERLVPFVKEQVKDANAAWFADQPAAEHQVPFAIGSLGDVPPLVADMGKKNDGITYTSKTTGMKFVRIKAGKFMMGSPLDDTGRYDDEDLHEVTLTKDYFLGQFEVTRGQFRRFVDSEKYTTSAEHAGAVTGWDAAVGGTKTGQGYSWRNPGYEQTDDHPVVLVSWRDATAFCKWLSGKDGREYRLPTEAEWERACRAGTTSPYSFGSDPAEVVRFGNASAPGEPDGYPFTAPVGRFKPNPWGLYDMHGNVYEWCQDVQVPYGTLDGSVNPAPLAEAAGDRIIRGGSWWTSARSCRSANRGSFGATQHFIHVGFRVCLRTE